MTIAEIIAAKKTRNRGLSAFDQLIEAAPPTPALLDLDAALAILQLPRTPEIIAWLDQRIDHLIVVQVAGQLVPLVHRTSIEALAAAISKAHQLLPPKP